MGNLCILLLLSCASYVLTLPTNDQSFVVSTTETSKEGSSDDNSVSEATSTPQIYEMDVNADVSNRFGKTLITSKVRNPATKSQEVTFSVILPEKAFISEFIMEIGGKSYKALVKEKEKAKQIYNEAVSSGLSAAHVAVSARDSNRFTVSVNVEAEGKATFYLTYEELLERKNDMYEIVINIHPGQIVKDLGIKVNIKESKKLTFVRTPSLRSGNEISKSEDGLEPNTNIEIVNDTSAVVTFNPDIDQQKRFAEKLGTDKENGLSGQFVIQYDVDRDSEGGEILVKDGYFVHFFAPKDIEPLPKHVVFVLDNSGSMYGKIDQLKKAMDSILSELREADVFNIMDFDSSVRIWDIESSEYKDFSDYPVAELDKLPKESTVLEAVPAQPANIAKAKELVEKLNVLGATNIIGGLEAGIYSVRNAKNIDRTKYQPLIIFLTDGEPNVRFSDPNSIINEVEKLNNEERIPIFSLSFGDGADKDFLRKLSLKNLGFSRHIYIAADAHLQLQDFYRQIASPLLNNVTFEYVDQVQEVTKTSFPIYFGGGEFVVAGRYRGQADIIDPGFSGPQVWGNGINGRLQLKPVKQTAVTDLERLWAYLTIKQKLDERDRSDNKETLEKEALDLALKYSFVTPVTSLVVVKPNDTSAIDTEDASKARPNYGYPVQPLSINGGPNYLTSGYAGPAVVSLRGGGSYYQAARPAVQDIPYDSGLQYHYLSGPPAPQYQGASLDSGIQRSPVPTLPRLHYASASLDYDQEDLNEYAIYPDTSYGSPLATTTRLPVPTSIASVSTTETSSPSYITSLDELKARLPWLANILDADQKFDIKGTTYDLGLGKSSPDQPKCSNSPAGNEGQCRLLHECPQAHKYLDDLAKYETFFCSLHEFAGVCCPTSTDIVV